MDGVQRGRSREMKGLEGHAALESVERVEGKFQFTCCNRQGSVRGSYALAQIGQADVVECGSRMEEEDGTPYGQTSRWQPSNMQFSERMTTTGLCRTQWCTLSR